MQQAATTLSKNATDTAERAAAFHEVPSAGPTGFSADDIEKLPSLLGYRTTWRLLGWWTVAYGLSSWIVEYLVSQLDPAANVGLLFAFNRVVYAVVWSAAIIVAIIATERLPVTNTRQLGR